MGSPYLNNLIHIAKVELPQLAYDVDNASTIFTLQKAAKEMLNILMYVVHHSVLSDPSVATAQAAAARAAAAAPSLPPPPAGFRYVRGADQRIYLEQIPVQPAVATAMPVGHAPAVDHFPSQAPAAPATAMPPPAFGLPPIGRPAAEPGGAVPVAEVTITPQGSRVAVPGQPVMVMPPGVPVDAASALAPARPIGASGIPGLGIPVAAVPGVPVGAPGAAPVDVVVADGMSAEVAAALAGRQGEQPLIDASGGARNVTNE